MLLLSRDRSGEHSVPASFRRWRIRAMAAKIVVKATNLNDYSDLGNLMVGRDGNIPARDQVPSLKQAGSRLQCQHLLLQLFHPAL
jgi:hypothetical protein